jgi:CRP/FNR family cyclic AMP-dependent transcriptional regulator
MDQCKRQKNQQGIGGLNTMVDLFQRIAFLKNTSIFREVNTDDLRFVADVLEEEPCFNGDTIFEKNDQGDYLYIVINGEVGITLDAARPNFVATMTKGDCFGEMNLIDDLPRSATAVVLQDGLLLKLGKQKLRGLILSYPELGLGMLKALSMRLRATTNRIERNG